MSNNNGLISLFQFLSNTVRNLEIPDKSPITCFVTDTPLENQGATQSKIINNTKMDVEQEFSYTLESVEYICQDCNESFSSVKLHENHVQEYHVFMKPHESSGITNLAKLFQKISSKNLKNSTGSNESKISFACKDNKTFLNLSENNKSRITESIKHENSPKTVQSMYVSKKSYYECNSCEAKFLHRENIIRHIRENHLRNLLGGSNFKSMSIPINQYKCEVCDDEFSNGRGLMEHKRDNHAVNQPIKIKSQYITKLGRKFKCNICPSHYTHRRDLLKHKRVKHPLNISEDEKLKFINETRIKFKCDICPTEYIRNSDLIRHKQNKHSLNITEVEKSKFIIEVDKKFECNICQALFDTSRSVLIHKRNEHPLDQSNDEKSNLSPINKTNFKCDICQKYYSSIWSLGRHKRNLHPSDSIENSFNLLNA